MSYFWIKIEIDLKYYKLHMKQAKTYFWVQNGKNKPSEAKNQYGRLTYAAIRNKIE
jgi:hypothetical protein